MKHPTAEDLMSWFYGEGPKEVGAHVKNCGQCRSQVEAWRGTAKALDELPAPATRRSWTTAPVRWMAMAAAFMILGIVAGRFVFGTSEGRMRASIQKEMQGQQQVVAQLVSAQTARLETEFAAALQQARAEDRAAYLLALKELSAKHEADLAIMKKGFETVVALADYGFEATEQRLAQIAAATVSSPQE